MALGSGHAFMFTPTIGCILAELALDETPTDDVSLFTAVSLLNASPATTDAPVHPFA